MRRPPSDEPLADLTRYIVEHLVDEPEAVTVSQTEDDGQAVIEAIVRAAAGNGPVPVLEVADG